MAPSGSTVINVQFGPGFEATNNTASAGLTVRVPSGSNVQEGQFANVEYY